MPIAWNKEQVDLLPIPRCQAAPVTQASARARPAVASPTGSSCGASRRALGHRAALGRTAAAAGRLNGESERVV